jgi:hypothetical protein
MDVAKARRYKLLVIVTCSLGLFDGTRCDTSTPELPLYQPSTVENLELCKYVEIISDISILSISEDAG